MALQISKLICGFQFEESYWKITNYSFNSALNVGSFHISPYANRAARLADVRSNILNAVRVYDITSPLTTEECYNFAVAKIDSTKLVDGVEAPCSFFDGAESV